jgi:L-methionine (R)-S-oxide reductase
MAGSLSIPQNLNSTEAVFEHLLPQLRALLEGETDETACMANTAAALMDVFPQHWIGFYRVSGNELVLGPFQGPIACTRIQKGKGVCGTAWMRNETIVVDDVDQFPGHIACSALSKSEIVVPLRNNQGDVMAVLDIDSDRHGAFDEAMKIGFEQICSMLSTHIYG